MKVKWETPKEESQVFVWLFYEGAAFFKQKNWSGMWPYFKGFKDPDWKHKKIWLAQFRVSLFTSVKAKFRVWISELQFADHTKSNESKHSFYENLGKPQCFCLLFKLHNLLIPYFKKY